MMGRGRCMAGWAGAAGCAESPAHAKPQPPATQRAVSLKKCAHRRPAAHWSLACNHARGWQPRTSMFHQLCASAQQVPFATAPAALAGPLAALLAHLC